MKHEESTLRTRLEMAAALKSLMQKKPLSKITVSDIVAACNINRKTFYYHFQDVKELLQWTLQRETVEVVRRFDLLIDYEDAIRFVIRYIHENAHILNCAYDSGGRDELKSFIYNNFEDMIRKVVDDCEKQNGLAVTKNFKTFLCDFVTEAIAGMLVTGFKSKAAYNEDEVVKHFTIILDSLPQILKRASMEKE